MTDAERQRKRRERLRKERGPDTPGDALREARREIEQLLEQLAATAKPFKPAADPSSQERIDALTKELATARTRIRALEAEVAQLRLTKPASSPLSTFRGELAMDDRLYKLIQAFIHPDRAGDETERRRRHDAFLAFQALPIKKLGDAERKAAKAQQEREAQRQAEASAMRARRQAGAAKAKETKRRNAEAKA
jgi:hypothetical protein